MKDDGERPSFIQSYTAALPDENGKTSLNLHFFLDLPTLPMVPAPPAGTW
jgi:hypothetical protein